MEINVKEKLEEITKKYKEKRQALAQATQAVKSIEVDCIALEGQISLLKEIGEHKKARVTHHKNGKKM
jgi:flagellar biosynthesis chaperone FliJ